MSHSLVWFAVQGIDPDEFLDRADLLDTEEPDEFFDADIAGATFPGGWFVVTSSDFSMMDIENLKEWSEGGRLIAVAVEEEVLTSIATEWVNGKMVWSISHEPVEGEPEIAVEGTLPPCFGEVKEKYAEALDGQTPAELAFMVSIEVAHRITGFHHESLGFDEDAPVFTVLEQQ